MKYRRWSLDETRFGRELLEAAVTEGNTFKLDLFYHWIENNVLVDIKLVRQTMGVVFRARDSVRALKLYDAMMLNYSPIHQAIGSTIRLGIVVLVWSGIIGGAVYLFRLVF